MKQLNQKLLQQFFLLAGDQLKGDFILIGGTVLPALGVDHRSTTDIDFIGKTAAERAQSLQLMEIAEQLDLAIEAVNQAGALFLSKIPGFEKHLVLLHQGKSARIYRPDATLFLLLKIPRMTESDLEDCLEWLNWCKKNRERPNERSIIIAIQREIKNAESQAKIRRLRALLAKF
jgi:hypothetical protein